MEFNFRKSKLNTQDTNNQNLETGLNFYICGSGGCGSTLIYNYLKQFGKSYHIHDRYPPEKLCYVGSENTNSPVYSEWFNKTEIPEDKLKSYKVIFVYRNPIPVIFSRCSSPSGPNVPHLQHIKCKNNGKIYFKDVIASGIDLYGLEEFFDNYTIPKKRNYDIICVKYEDFFNNISIFNNVLGIPDINKLYPVKRERVKIFSFVNELITIYNSLMKKMNMMKFIEIIKPLKDEKISDENNI